MIFFKEWYIINKLFAEMAERSNAHDSKSCYAGMYTRVQIPFSAPQKKIGFVLSFFVGIKIYRKGFEGEAASESERFALYARHTILSDGKTNSW